MKLLGTASVRIDLCLADFVRGIVVSGAVKDAVEMRSMNAPDAWSSIARCVEGAAALYYDDLK